MAPGEGALGLVVSWRRPQTLEVGVGAEFKAWVDGVQGSAAISGSSQGVDGTSNSLSSRVRLSRSPGRGLVE